MICVAVAVAVAVVVQVKTEIAVAKVFYSIMVLYYGTKWVKPNFTSRFQLNITS